MPLASQFQPIRSLFVVLAEEIRSYDPEVDISGVMQAVETVLDHSIAPQGYVITEPKLVDISQIDFEGSKGNVFAHGPKADRA